MDIHSERGIVTDDPIGAAKAAMYDQMWLRLIHIVAFIRARLQDEQDRSWAVHDVSKCDALLYAEDLADAARREPVCDCGMPARVLRGVEAKRRIVERHEPLRVTETDFAPRWICKSCDAMLVGSMSPCPTLRLLASEWSDHPDHQPDWTP